MSQDYSTGVTSNQAAKEDERTRMDAERREKTRKAIEESREEARREEALREVKKQEEREAKIAVARGKRAQALEEAKYRSELRRLNAEEKAAKGKKGPGIGSRALGGLGHSIAEFYLGPPRRKASKRKKGRGHRGKKGRRGKPSKAEIAYARSILARANR